MMAQRLTTVLACLAGLVLATGLVALGAEDFLPQGSGNTPMPPAFMPPAFGPGAPNPWGNSSGNPAGPPTCPTAPPRPDTWPGGRPPAIVPGTQPPPGGPYPPAAGRFPPADVKPCESAQILGRVPGDVVLVSDLYAQADELLNRNKDKIPAKDFEKQRAELVRELTAGIQQLVEHLGDPNPGSYVDASRRALIQQLLHQQIERKMIYQDFMRTVPKEALPNIEQMVNREFERMQLPVLLKRENVQSREDLEWKLREHGSSLDREKRIFMEQAVAEQWIQQQVKGEKEVEITHEQMLAWYQAHLADFEKPARAQWEELMVSLGKYPRRGDAYAAVAAMGNQVLAGASLADVARARSDGPTAAKGGLRDWTSKGSLVSEELDRALFSLPVGQLSPILESSTGYHILRVVARQEAGRTPFADAQKEIRKKIEQERTQKQYREYIVKIQKEFPVWTIFDATATA
ncbi:MAG: peptidyl-prolyl cis-trans isomerase, partial [Thermoguttaceae bacterium]